MWTPLSWVPLGTSPGTSCLLTRLTHPGQCPPRRTLHGEGHRGELTASTACPQAPRHLCTSPHFAESFNCTSVPSPPSASAPHTRRRRRHAHLPLPPPAQPFFPWTDPCTGAPSAHTYLLPACVAMALPLVFRPSPIFLGRGGAQQNRGGSRRRNLSPSSPLPSSVTLGEGPFPL